MNSDIQVIVAWLKDPFSNPFLLIAGALILAPILLGVVTFKLWRRDRPIGIFRSGPVRFIFRMPVVTAALFSIAASVITGCSTRAMSAFGQSGWFIIACLIGIFCGFIISAGRVHRFRDLFIQFPVALLCFIASPVILVIAATDASPGGGDQRGMGIVMLPIFIAYICPFICSGQFYGWLAVGRYTGKNEPHPN